MPAGLDDYGNWAAIVAAVVSAALFLFAVVAASHKYLGWPPRVLTLNERRELKRRLDADANEARLAVVGELQEIVVEFETNINFIEHDLSHGHIHGHFMRTSKMDENSEAIKSCRLSVQASVDRARVRMEPLDETAVERRSGADTFALTDQHRRDRDEALRAIREAIRELQAAQMRQFR